MATEQPFVVTGGQYREIHRKMRDILRQLDQKGGSPLNPATVSLSLQEIDEGRVSSLDGIVCVRRDPGKEMPMDSDNPSPFKQPFLFIRFGPNEYNGRGYGWYVDVDGKIGLYLKDPKTTGSEVNRMSDATDLMKDIVSQLAKQGKVVSSIGTYKGSAGPTHILRNGALFRRVCLNDPAGIISDLPSHY